MYFSYLKYRQYHDIASVVLKHFPYLAKESLNYNDAVGLWHGRIKTQFRNKRYRTKYAIPEILANRKKFGGKRKAANNLEGETSRKITRCWGVDNFLSGMPEGDYDFTLKKFQQVLREQHNQPLHKQNSKVIDRMMRKIFPYRRKLLVKYLVRLTELIQIYPVLCSEEQVIFFSFLKIANVMSKILTCIILI